MTRTTLQVKGMHCNACETLLQDVLEDEGATEVKADHASGEVIIEHDEKLTQEQMAKAIKEEGYEVQP